MLAAASGVELATYTQGDPANPTVLLVHGFPDDHSVWDRLAQRLADDFHVVTYDVRGAGASSRPARTADYRLDALAADLQAVIDHVGAGRGVHLVGHDWGSVQGWHLVTDPMHRGVLSFTSISGPCLDHVSGWMGRRVEAKQWGALARLWKSPIYMGTLQVPVLAPLLCRSGALDAMIAAAAKIYERPESPSARPTGAGARTNAASVRMYAANLIPRLRNSERGGTTVPVQILTPSSDAFIPPVSQRDPHPDVPTWRVREVPGGHWAPANNPSAIAALLAEWVEQWQLSPATGRNKR